MPWRMTSVVSAEDARDLVQTRDVVLVVLDGIEGHGVAACRPAMVWTPFMLVDRHLVALSARSSRCADCRHALHELVVREQSPARETGGVDGRETGEIRVILLVLGDLFSNERNRPGDRCSDSRRRRSRAPDSHAGRPVLLFEESVLRGDAHANGWRGRPGQGRRGAKSEVQSKAQSGSFVMRYLRAWAWGCWDRAGSDTAALC